jgi:ABC-type glycerol-3-phosphate transport system substrate-binding protein
MEEREQIKRISEAFARGRISRRRFMEMMAAVGVGAFAAGCVPSAAPPAAPAATAAPAGAPTQAPEAAAATGKKITANYMASGTYDKAAEYLKPIFEQRTGNSVELVTFPWQNLNQANITDLSTQTGQYDVISGEFWLASVFQHMLPLDDLVARDNIGPEYIPNLFQPGPSNFFEGKRISIPYSADAYAILYNQELFEMAGVEPKWDTWEDYIQVLDALQGKLPDGVSPHSFSFGNPEQPGSIFLGAYDGFLINKDNQFAVDREKAISALETTMKLVDYGPANVRSLSIDESTAVFLQGRSAALVGWPSFIRAQADDPAASEVVGKWQLGSYPGPGFPLLSCWNLFISSYSTEQDVAWEWIKAYANPANGKEFMVQFGIGSPFKSTYEDEELLKEHAHDFPAQAANLGRAKAMPHTFEAYEVLFRNLGDMLTGSATAEQVVERWHQSWAEMAVPAALIESAERQGLKEM